MCSSDLGINWHEGASTIDETIIEHKCSKSVNLKLPLGNKLANFKWSHEKRSNIFDPDDVSLKMIDKEIIPTTVQKCSLDLNLLDKYGFDMIQGKLNWSQKLDLEVQRVYGDCSYLNSTVSSSSNIDLRYGVD